MRAFKSVNEVLDFAINAEIEACKFYMKLADFVESPEMAEVLSDLAEVELEHKAKLEAVKAGRIALNFEEIGDLGITERVKDVETDAKMSYIDMLVLGMKKEEAARRLYTNLAKIAQNQQLRNIFLKLAQQEAAHKLRFELEYDLRTF
jgi:rubrerythrin